VYVSGNMMMYYVPGDKRRHISPDVFVTFGIPKLPERKYYLVWEEGKGPDVIFEISSKSTKRDDLGKKFTLYRDTLRVQEYFLFDPEEEYLTPSLQGFRLEQGDYVRIEPVAGRLPSQLLGLHLERQGSYLRLYDPATGQILPTPQEQVVQHAAALQNAAAEIERLRRELAALRGERPPSS
jgi:Uma2 family endonuclease